MTDRIIKSYNTDYSMIIKLDTEVCLIIGNILYGRIDNFFYENRMFNKSSVRNQLRNDVKF